MSGPSFPSSFNFSSNSIPTFSSFNTSPCFTFTANSTAEPMQICQTSSISYNEIATGAMEKLFELSKTSIQSSCQLYEQNALFTVKFHRAPPQQSTIEEIKGPDSYTQKMQSIGLNQLGYSNMVWTAQPISAKMVMVTAHGTATIQSNSYPVVSTCILKITNTKIVRISNHVLEFHI